MTRRLRSGVALTALALLTAACGDGSSGGAAGNLPLLPGGGGGARSAVAESATMSAVAESATMSAGADMAIAPARPVTYRAGEGLAALDGTAPAYRMAAAPTEADARRVAQALGLTGEARTDEGGAMVVDGSGRSIRATRSG